MKKIIVSLLALMLILSVCASAEEYAAGWYTLSNGDGVVISSFFLPEGSSVSLPDSFTLSPLEAGVSFTVEPGVYTVGVDIPAGKYTIAPTEEWPDYVNYSIEDTDGLMLIGGVIACEENTVIGNIDLKDGYVVMFDGGSAHFVPSTGGIVFD